jgi:hypothetical protein|tara:strand:+ start:64 stop:351 length:288 start_codon:yes stop_codon:yes gene_type:complete
MSRVNYPSPYVITKDRVGSDLVYENVSSQINGSRTVFNLAQEADTERIFVYYNGLLINADVDSFSDQSFTLSFAPASPDNVQVIYSIKGDPINET